MTVRSVAVLATLWFAAAALAAPSALAENLFLMTPDGAVGAPLVPGTTMLTGIMKSLGTLQRHTPVRYAGLDSSVSRKGGMFVPAREARPTGHRGIWGPVDPAPACGRGSSPMTDKTELYEATGMQFHRGSLQLHTEPWTIVFIDGSLEGATPVFRDEIQVGTHRLRMLNEEFGIDTSEEITVDAGQRKAIFRRFHGMLEIDLPEGTETNVNGERIRDNGPRVTRKVPCGYHQVRRICLQTRKETLFNVLVKNQDRVLVR